MRTYHRKPVFLTDDNGMVIKRYNDAGEAGKDLGMARSGVQYHCVNKTSRNLRYEEDISTTIADHDVWCRWCKSYSDGWCMRWRRQRRAQDTCGEFKINKKYIDNDD